MIFFQNNRNYKILEEENEIAARRKQIQMEREQLYLEEGEVGMNVKRRYTQVPTFFQKIITLIEPSKFLQLAQ